MSDLLLGAVTAFLHHEARLLDEQRWQEWDSLFTDDGIYWVPANRNQPDPRLHVSLMHENRLLRQVRIKRFDVADAYSLQPFPHSSHLISNVAIDRHDAASGAIDSYATFLMVQAQGATQTLFAGSYRHQLVRDGASFRIRQKKVELVNCDAPHASIHLYF